MKRHLTIAIDANRVTCGECYGQHKNSDNLAICLVFGSYLKGYRLDAKWDAPFRRCAPCLAAEREGRE